MAERSSSIVVVGCGMITPVGLSTRETAASTRARTARLTSIEWRDRRRQRFTAGVVPDDALEPLKPELGQLPLSYREARMLRLGQLALLEAMVPLPKSAGAVPLFLGLPELHTKLPLLGGQFISRLSNQCGTPLNLEASNTLPRGRASALAALHQASEQLAQEKTRFAIIGGVDTNVDLYILGSLDLQKRVRTDVNPDGLVPGEGAGFLLLTTDRYAQEHRLPVLAKIVSQGSAREEGHLESDQPYKGEGLAAAFAAALGNASALPPIERIYASFNGEHYWAKEFGVALLRNRERFEESYQMEHPAECFGDLGAAHGAVMLGLACTEIKKYQSKKPWFVFSSSDLGDRQTVILSGDNGTN